MPIVQTWISDEDYVRYLSIKRDKKAWTEFVHNALEMADAYKQLPPGEKRAVKEHIKKMPLPAAKVMSDAQRLQPAAKVSPNLVKESVGVNLCKIHGTPLTMHGKCLMKGCKYA